MEERRRVARWQINQEAGLTVESGINSIPCVVEDISLEGMRVSLNKNLFDEAFANFKLTLAEDFEFSAGANVSWHDAMYERNIYGLSFNRMAGETKSRLSEYVKNNFHAEIVKQWWKGV
jgi:pyridoxine 5'-phosphate synthase PdxJ